ncbi:hypothetical protein VNO77_39150 [Canavalia gladiata]|uniref:Uncharacterized protein n=1 Tax=Canavalia gladiata TaxID=3824 RepID=A0AAN9KC24_CANGL
MASVLKTPANSPTASPTARIASLESEILGLYILMGYDLVWRNCLGDYVTPAPIRRPQALDGCVAIVGCVESKSNLVHCVAESLDGEIKSKDMKVWSAPDSYTWICHVNQNLCLASCCPVAKQARI